MIFCDPADYYLNSEKLVKKGTWSGSEKYQPKVKTVSSLLKKVKGKSKVHVVHFMLRNHGPNGYEEKDFKKRGQDNPKLFPRLNTQMVKKFYQNLPKKNQGKYIEDHQIPHGINRDGDKEKNQLNLSKLILKCFT